MTDSSKHSLTFSRRRLLEGAASLAACSLLPDSAAASTALVTPNGPVVQGALMVMTNAIGAIPPRFLGLSYEKITMSYSYFHTTNSNLIALFRRLGNGVLRIGGGSVDEVLWAPTGSGTHLQVTPANIKALAGFLQATGWGCLYGVNLATSTPALAAEEAAYAVATLGPSLLGIEIGNEPDGYGGQFFTTSWNFQAFLARWNLFRAAIIQAVPHAPFAGPVTAGANHITGWTLPFGQAVTPSELAMLTQHYYRASGASPSSTASLLISPDAQLVADLKTLDAGAQQLGIPYRISECNSFYGGGAAGVSNSYASSLWVIDFLFNAALGGAAGVNMHGGGQGPGYTPIADDSGAVIAARPEYYGLLFFSLAGPGTLLATQLSVGSANATAYAVRSASGGLNVMVVNKGAENLTLAIETNQNIRTATLQIMTGPALAATSGVTIQGASVNADGSFAPAKPGSLPVTGTQTTCSIPALSAGLISIA